MELAQPRFDNPVGYLPYRDRKDQTPVRTVYAYAGRYVKNSLVGGQIYLPTKLASEIIRVAFVPSVGNQ